MKEITQKISTEEQIKIEIDKLKKTISERVIENPPCDKALKRLHGIENLMQELNDLKLEFDIPNKLMNDILTNGICPLCGEDLSVNQDLKPGYEKHKHTHNIEKNTILCNHCGKYNRVMPISLNFSTKSKC